MWYGNLRNIKELNKYSRLALLSHSISGVILMSEFIISSLMLLWIHSLNSSIENPLLVIFALAYFPMAPVQLYLSKKLTQQKPWAGQAALVTDFFVILAAALNLVVVEWHSFETSYTLALALIALSFLEVFLLVVTPARQLRGFSEELDY